MILNEKDIDKIKNEIVIIYEEQFYKVFVPLTFEASYFYGHDTKWCTTRLDNPEMFTNVSKRACMFRITFSNGYKMRLTWGLNLYVWADAEGYEISGYDDPFDIIKIRKLRLDNNKEEIRRLVFFILLINKSSKKNIKDYRVEYHQNKKDQEVICEEWCNY